MNASKECGVIRLPTFQRRPQRNALIWLGSEFGQQGNRRLLISPDIVQKETMVGNQAAARAVNVGYKFRIYRTPEQQIFLAKSFGSCRFVFNWALERKQTAYKQSKQTLNKYALMEEMALLKRAGCFFLVEGDKLPIAPSSD